MQILGDKGNKLKEPGIPVDKTKGRLYFGSKGVFLMVVTPTGNGIIASIAAQAMILKEAQLQTDVNVAILSDVLDFQEELAAKLVQSLGIGQNVDVIV